MHRIKTQNAVANTARPFPFANVGPDFLQRYGVRLGELDREERRRDGEPEGTANRWGDKFFHSNLQGLEPKREITAGPSSPLQESNTPQTSISDES